MKLTTGIGVLFAAMAVMFEPEWVRHPIPACFVMSLVGFVFLLELGGDKDAKRVINWISDDRDGKSWQRAFYERILGGALDWLDTHLNPEALERGDDPRGYSRAWGWRLYDKCLFLALLYPLVFLFISWVLSPGKAGMIGDFAVLEAQTSQGRRILTLLILALLFLYVLNINYIMARLQSVFESFAVGPTLSELLAGVVALAVAGAVALAVAVAGAGALAGAVAVAGVVAGAGAGAVAGALAGALAVAVAVAGAVAGALALIYGFTYLHERRPALAYLLLIPIAMAGFGYALLAGELNEGVTRLIIFLGLLPLVNAQFDFLSTIATRNLLRRGLQAGPWGQIGWGLLDFGIGIGLFIALALSATALAHGANLLSGQALINLPAIFSNPSAHYWLFFAFLTTLLPTFIHAILWTISFFTLWPKSLRDFCRGKIEAYYGEHNTQHGSEMDLNLAYFAVAALFSVGMMRVILLGYGLYWLAKEYGDNAGSAILRLCEWVYLTLDTLWPSIAPPAI